MSGQWAAAYHAGRAWDQQWHDLAQAWSIKNTVFVLIAVVSIIVFSTALAIWATPPPQDAEEGELHALGYWGA